MRHQLTGRFPAAAEHTSQTNHTPAPLLVAAVAGQVQRVGPIVCRRRLQQRRCLRAAALAAAGQRVAALLGQVARLAANLAGAARRGAHRALLLGNGQQAAAQRGGGNRWVRQWHGRQVGAGEGAQRQPQWQQGRVSTMSHACSRRRSTAQPMRRAQAAATTMATHAGSMQRPASPGVVGD